LDAVKKMFFAIDLSDWGISPTLEKNGLYAYMYVRDYV